MQFKCMHLEFSKCISTFLHLKFYEIRRLGGEISDKSKGFFQKQCVFSEKL